MPSRTLRRARRSLALGVALAAALAVVGPLAAAGAAGGGGGGDDSFATLKVTADTVEVKAKDEDAFEKAADGDELRAGDTVRTDATGKAEIQYGDDAYTRLDSDTTFKITKLTDDEGNRQVEGTLEKGKTWNRTAGLTESESFEQTGADATAAVEGTAFAVICDTTEHCVFTGVVDDVTLTGKDGVTKLLSPLDECDSDAGILCADITKISADDLPQWILDNLILDLARGYPWPFGNGTVVVQDGAIFFVPSPPTPPPPPPSTAPTLGTDALICNDSCENEWTPVSPYSADAEADDPIVPGFFDPVAGNEIVTTDNLWNAGVKFVPNVTTNPTDKTLYLVFKELPDDVGFVWVFCDGCEPSDTSAASSYYWPLVAEINTPYRLGAPPVEDAGALTGGNHVTYFKFVPVDIGEPWYYPTTDPEGWVPTTDQMVFFVTTDPTLSDASQASADATVDVTVYDDEAEYYPCSADVTAGC